MNKGFRTFRTQQAFKKFVEKTEKAAVRTYKKEQKEKRSSRRPTAYNKFVKENMPVIKDRYPVKERFREIGKLWKMQKRSEMNDNPR
jgi:hypothetical protein